MPNLHLKMARLFLSFEKGKNMSGFIVNENLIEDNINNNKYKTKKKKILDAAIIFLASVFLVCIFFIGRYFWQSLRNNGLNEDLANDAVSYGDSQINQEDSQGDSNNNNDTDSVDVGDLSFFGSKIWGFSRRI